MAQGLEGSQLLSKMCPHLLPLPHSDVLGYQSCGFLKKGSRFWWTIWFQVPQATSHLSEPLHLHL